MRKVIKILGKVVAAFVLLLLLLPVGVSVLLDIPAVQNFVVHRAADFVSRKLETTVSIGRVRIGLFNRLRAEDFYVEDYQGDTLLYVRDLGAYVTGFGILSDGVILGRAEARGVQLHLRETPDSVMNIKQLIERLSNPDKPKKGNFKLTISSASIDSMELRIERLEHRNPEYGVDFWNMHFIDLHAAVKDLVIAGSQISMDIESLGSRGRSGFEVAEVQGYLKLDNGSIRLDEAALRTRRSSIYMPHIAIEGGSWADFKDFVHNVRIDAAVRRSRLAMSDVAYFAPSLRRWNTTFSRMDFDVEGTVADFRASIDRLETGAETRLEAVASVQGLPDVRRTRFDLESMRLTTVAADLDQMLASFGNGKGLPDGVVRVVDRSGRIHLTGQFAGTLSSFRMRSALTTSVGGATCNLTVKPAEGMRRHVQGQVAVQEVHLGELLDNPRLGRATVTARVDGVLGRGLSDGDLTGEVQRFEFNGYGYDSLRFDGHLFNREFDGRIAARDPHLNFDFAGLFDLNDSVPRYDFALDLRRADLAALHFNRRDSVSQLKARIVAQGSGRSLDDMNGTIRVLDASYRYNDSLLQAREVLLRGENSAHNKSIELRSDFVDATFRSKTSYREIFGYLKEAAWRSLPMLYDRSRASDRESLPATAADDFSMLKVEVKNVNPVVDAITPGLQIANGSNLTLLFNPASDRLMLSASSDYLERERMLATKIRITASNRGDSLGFHAASEDFYMGMLHLHNLSMTGGAREGRVQLTTAFNDTVDRFSGQFSFAAGIAPEPGVSGRVLDVRILPSFLRRGDNTWRVLAQRISIDTARVDIDHFYVRNEQQWLLVNGIASRSREDSLTVRLRNFDLSPLSHLVDRMGYAIEGRTSGSATVKSALKRSEVVADIGFDSLAVNGIQAPPLQLVSQWDFLRNRARVAVSNRISRDTLVQGFYAPADGRYYAWMAVDSLDLGLLDPVLEGVVSGTEGRASAHLTLEGRGRAAELSGEIRAVGLSTTVDFTKVTYTAPEVLLQVEKNHLIARNVPLFDPEDNRGLMSIDLNLEHLSNIAYGVQVVPSRMLVLNTTPRDNDTFYGRIYASGFASITGDKRGVNMDITATTDDRSTFVLPLSGKSDISNADFVVFKAPAPKDAADLLAQKRRLFEQQRKQRTTTQGTMNISMELTIRPNLDLELEMAGSVLQGRGEGTLNLQINPRQNLFEMYGDYAIAEGSYDLSLQNLITRKFLIENGSTIQWTGSPMDARIDIDAIYKLKASLTPLLSGTTSNNVSGDRSVPVECVIHLGDQLLHPDISFAVRVPQTDPETQAIISEALATSETMDTQFFYLLVFGSFMSENENTASNLGASSFGTGLEFLSNQLSNLLSIGGYNINIDYRPKSELTSDELDFGLSKSLINDRLFVELEGNYIMDNSQTVNRMSNFMGEAYVTWLIDRAGTLRLRGFTQTIDRFDENQGLQETGIGIYYKEDFNNFKDLRERVRDRFSSRKRRERRLARRMARSRHDTLRIEPIQTDRGDSATRNDPDRAGDTAVYQTFGVAALPGSGPESAGPLVGDEDPPVGE